MQDADPQAEQHYTEQEQHDKCAADIFQGGHSIEMTPVAALSGAAARAATEAIAAARQWPNLAGVIDAEQIETIGSGKFSAAYVNWARTMHMMHEHAPGWLPFAEPATDGGLIHRSPAGCYMMIGFRNMHTQAQTPLTPQAVMDNKNKAIAYDSITARDITDTHRRGLCQAAAMFFGLAYELWAKDEVESGYAKQERARAEAEAAKDNSAEVLSQLEAVLAQLEAQDPEKAAQYRGLVGEKSNRQIIAWVTKALTKGAE